MTGTVKGIPAGASDIIPRLFCRGVVAEIVFCLKTFGAVDRVRRLGRDQRAAHANADYRSVDDHDRGRMAWVAKPPSCFGRQLSSGDLRLC